MSASAFLKFSILRSRVGEFFGNTRALHQARFAKLHELERLYEQILDAPQLLLGVGESGRRRPVTVYLRWPERSLEALTPLIRLVWSALIEEIAHIYDTASSPGFFKILLLVDEAGRAPVPSLAKHITTAAGRGMTIWMALQSLSQLQTEYGASRAETIKDNMDTQLFYRPANHDGAKRLREWLGDATGFAQSRTLGRPKQDGQVRIAQAFLDFRNEIVAQFDIDLAEPRLDLLSFELGGNRLDELLVFRAVGKKDFHTVGTHYRYTSR